MTIKYCTIEGSDVRRHSDRAWRDFVATAAALRTTTMSSSSLLESGTRQSPPQHKHDQVQAFREDVRWLERFNEEQFLEYLGVSNSLIPSEIPDLPQSLSIDGFCSMANDIAQSIKATREYHLLCIYLFLTAHDFSLDFQKSDLLVFKDTGNKIPNGHVPGIMCRPDITAAFEKDWINEFSVAWLFDSQGSMHPKANPLKIR